MSKPYLICCAAIIAIAIGADNFIKITKSKAKYAIVTGRVYYRGKEPKMTSSAMTHIPASVMYTHVHDMVLKEGKQLTLYPGCKISFGPDAFTFNGGSPRWSYTHGRDTEPSTYTKINREIEAITQTAFQNSYSVGWTVDCEKTIMKKFPEFSSQITTIIITANRKHYPVRVHTPTRPRSEGMRAGDEIPIHPDLKAPLTDAPSTTDIFDKLSESLYPLPASDKWMKSYWAEFYTYLVNHYADESAHFLEAMIDLSKHYKYAMTPEQKRDKMTEIYEKYISPTGDEPINIGRRHSAKLRKLATKKPLAWVNKENELVSPTTEAWRVVIDVICTLLDSDVSDSSRAGFERSERYEKWLDGEDGLAYKRLAYKKMTEEPKASKATTKAKPKKKIKKPFYPPVALAPKKKIKKPELRAFESYYNYNGYDGYDDDDSYDDDLYYEQIIAAYWRGYRNGLKYYQLS